MSQLASSLKLLKNGRYKSGVASVVLMAAMSAQAAPTVTANDPAVTSPIASQTVVDQANNTLAAQMQPSNKALSSANQDLLSRNAQLQRQVNDLQTQTNVLVYESKGQLFLYGAFTVLISLLVGIFISWLVFVRRQRW
ncbi:hypothetical protein RCH20_000520 [Psychrobacter sp. PL15]|uniref:hypothetical protein n=1 Tax=Psychrobacter sp. PL15 TaxID=3071719 RepID=UPI002DFDD06D|nr:hypothetical protein [Psychrobacter sp. PL15]